jgi:hypothetical protein
MTATRRYTILSTHDRTRRLERVRKAVARGVKIHRACDDAGIPYHVWHYWTAKRVRE